MIIFQGGTLMGLGLSLTDAVHFFLSFDFSVGLDALPVPNAAQGFGLFVALAIIINK